jgi:hypothetical protein
MSNRSERELEQEIRRLFEQAFRAGLVLGSRLRDMPAKLAKDISAARGDAGKIEGLIRAELESVLDAALSKLSRHLQN